jgi:imidazole glycerol phosphate synthase subunit HisF
MKQWVAFVAFAGLTLTAAAWAASGFGTAAIVVSVDPKAKTITFKHSDKGVWKETVATWDEKTEWARADKEVWDTKPATVALAGELRKDAKVYVTVYDRGGPKFWIENLKTIPPGFEVK